MYNLDWKVTIEGIVSDFLKSKKNSNRLLQLEELLLSSDEVCVLSMIKAVSDLFFQVFSRECLKIKSSDKNLEYKTWLLNRYEDFVSHLISYLFHHNAEIQIASLRTLMLFIQLESKNPSKDIPKESKIFPYPLFKRIISGLASNILDQHHLIEVLEEYTCYDDVKLYLLKSIQELFTESDSITDLFLENSFMMLCSFKFPDAFENSASANIFTETGHFQVKEKPFRRLFSSAWRCLLNYELSSALLKKVLPVLNEKVLPNLQNPSLLTDFLTSAYNKGGVLSLLALNGLFLLMEKYNLEYPDFFTKLYTLLDGGIINGKFSARFFHLTHLFLSSTHLPAHIVASFAKKLSRLSLVSSANTIMKILCLISNLLSNHPSLGFLIHQADGQDRSTDEFDFHAADPSQSNAMQSSLWEIKTLQSHINPDVSCRAKQLTSQFPKFPSDMAKLSSCSLYDLYTKMRKRKLDNVPLAVQKPVKMKRCS